MENQNQNDGLEINEEFLYAQRSYINKMNSYSMEEVKTGGKWIDNKPLYKITQPTVYDIPSNIETELPREVIGEYTVYHYTKTIDS